MSGALNDPTLAPTLPRHYRIEFRKENITPSILRQVFGRSAEVCVITEYIFDSLGDENVGEIGCRGAKTVGKAKFEKKGPLLRRLSSWRSIRDGSTRGQNWL